MSATNRGTVRREKDFYPTPESAFRPMLERLPFNRSYYEPACGDGRLVRWLQQFGHTAYGTDLVTGTDFMACTDCQDFIITNPPFSLALEFAQKSLSLSEDVLLLLPLGFLGAQKRRAWFQQREPDALFVLSERPSFTGNGRTDAADYAWFYWGPIWHGIKHL
jgi:hypothetical protein